MSCAAIFEYEIACYAAVWMAYVSETKM